MPEIIYEDNHLLVAVKPPNMLSQGDATGDANMLNLLKEYLRVKYQKPGAVYLGLVHRLDRPAGGLMVFARTSKAAGRLAEQMRKREVDKEYLAVVEGLATGARLNGWITDTAILEEEAPGAKKAVLSYDRLDAAQGLSLIKVQLETGRKHQIRLQMAHSGYPIWGDNRHGRGKPGMQLALWAYRLGFVHPVKKERMDFQAPPPETPPWTLFSSVHF